MSAIRTPRGPLTLSDLPRVGDRWTRERKTRVVLAVRGGLITLEGAMTRYLISAEEFEEWERYYDAWRRNLQQKLARGT